MIRKPRANLAVEALSLVCLAVSLSAGASLPAQAAFVVPEVLEITPGDAATLQLSLEQAQLFNGFQTDITLPEGLAIPLTAGKPDISLSTSCINSTHSIYAAAVSSPRTYRLVVFSTRNEPFASGDDLINISISAAEDFEEGIIEVYNTILTMTDGGDCTFMPLTVDVKALHPYQPDPLPDDFSANPSVSQTQMREGDMLTLSADMGGYGYPGGWQYEWTGDGAIVSDRLSCQLEMLMPAGDVQATDTRTFSFHASNYSPEGQLWAEVAEEAPQVTVYRAPETPASVVRKGDGTSRVLIAMMRLDDTMLSDRRYRFVFGYDDLSGERHIGSSSEKRYARYDEAVYDDPALPKWCYTEWVYPDGSTVSSGLRYLDGSVDPAFDASSFSAEPPTRHGDTVAPASLRSRDGQWSVEVNADSDVLVEVFTEMGSKVIGQTVAPRGHLVLGRESGRMRPGMHIVRASCDEGIAIFKIHIR